MSEDTGQLTEEEIHDLLRRKVRLTSAQFHDIMFLIRDQCALNRALLALQNQPKGTGALESSIERALIIIEKQYRVDALERGEVPADTTTRLIADKDTLNALADRFLGPAPVGFGVKND